MNFTCIARTHGAPAVPANREAWEQLRREPWLVEMCRRIEAGDGKLKHKLPVWTPHCAGFRDDHRSIKDAEHPLQRLMLDFDEKGHSKEILERSLQLQADGKWEILLVEDSVRRGTHVLVTLPAGMTAEEAQHRFSQDVGFQADAAVKDVSRCIYMVTEGHTLYVNERMFAVDVNDLGHGLHGFHGTRPLPNETSGRLDDTEACDKSASSHQPKATETQSDENPCNPCNPCLKDYPQTYDSIPYTTILETLEDQMGGAPEVGARNNFIFAMACHLRYITDDNPEWIATILPTYGEDREKWMQTIRSACNRPQSKMMSRVISRTLAVCKERKAEAESEAEENSELITHNSELPPMPEKLPPLIGLLVSRTPEIYRPAVAHAVFPSLATHLWKTYFRYIDNVLHEATLMNCLMAGTGAGKNCISEPINRILADIRERDRESLRREKDWKNDMNTKGANKDKKKRPEGLVVQEVDPDMTNAAFVMRLAEADERFLYAKMNELDQFDALKTSGGSKNHFQIMCLAFDPGNVYGQTRVGTSSVSERVCIRFNWNASTTIQKGQSYFQRVLTDGPVSRINFCTIPERPIGAELPVYGTYDEGFDEALRPYIERLNAARGIIECKEAELLARTLMEENAEFARLSQSRVYENLSFRANVIAYLKAMVLYVAHGEVWTPEMEDFVRWSLRYDLWCKMQFFGEAIEHQNGMCEVAKKPGPKNLLDLLPETFTREEATQMRQRQGIQGAAQAMLDNWKKRGYIVALDRQPPSDLTRQRFGKTEEYLRRYPQPVGQSVNRSIIF